MKKSKQLLLITALLFIWELPVIAQQPTDTTYIFRFVPNDDMFYVPWNGNDRSLHQLLNILEKNKKQLQAGQMYISVSSYAASANDILTSERMAYIRNNRIKSELITQGGLTEQMFVTDRAIPSSYGKEKLRNVVVVTFPASVEKVAEIAGIEAARRVENYNKERSGKAERERLSIEQAAREKAEAERLAKEQAEREHLAAQEKARKQAETERLAAEREEKERAEIEPRCRSRRKSEIPFALLAGKLAPLGYSHPRSWSGMALEPSRRHTRERLLHFLDVEQQRPSLCLVGNRTRSALLHR